MYGDILKHARKLKIFFQEGVIFFDSALFYKPHPWSFFLDAKHFVVDFLESFQYIR